MTVYQGLRLQVCLRETGLGAGFFFFFNVSSSDLQKKKKNGAGSWKSLKLFHSNYPKQLDGVY